MSTIGTVQKQPDGSFVGFITTLTVDATVRIVPVSDKPSDDLPDYRVFGRPNGDGKRRECELGAGWIRTSKTTGAEYVSLKLDDPSLRGPIYANLGRASGEHDDDVYAVIWTR